MLRGTVLHVLHLFDVRCTAEYPVLVDLRRLLTYTCTVRVSYQFWSSRCSKTNFDTFLILECMSIAIVDSRLTLKERGLECQSICQLFEVAE